jgi:2-dehydropantoate 2-reductase
MAVELASSGQDVCVVARGAHLRAIQQHGLKLVDHGTEKVARIAAAEDASAFGVQDVVICALKAHQAYDCATAFAPLLGPATAVLTAMNGIPWWYFYGTGSRFEGHHLQSVDPGGRQWNAIQPRRAIGCVVEPACEVVEPGVVVHHDLNRFIIGEPDGSRSSRVLELSRVLTEAGFDAPVRDNIRWNLWLKLWGNVCFNPISVLTGVTLDRIVGDPALRELSKTMMLEAKAVNEALGVQIPSDMMERRLAVAATLVGHKMSMLQDLERSRPLEIDALVTAVQELGDLTGVYTPMIDAVLALVQARGRAAGLYVPLGSSR